MKIKDCVLGAVVAAAIFAGANADTTASSAPTRPMLASVRAPGIAALRVCVGQVLDVVGAVAALAKQL